ncbi:MAG: peptide chain release factor N(5)-glutamine methyltransferase [Lapillicoccus sp.]
MTELKVAVRRATMTLAEAGIASAPVDALLLAAHLMGQEVPEVRRLMVLGGVDAPEGYEDLVAERASRIPLQHITGRAGFRYLELRVGPGVFVPRPETELVVELAVAALDALRSGSAAGPDRSGLVTPVVVDLATGSGAIALAVKQERPLADVYAVELSALAHGWAVANRDHLRLDVTIELSDALTAYEELVGLVDVVTCNPPYIPVGQVPIDPEVRDHDPALALYGGSEDGLATPRAMAARAAQLLRPGGVLVMEHAETQGSSLPRALAATGAWLTVVDHLDLVGRPRCLVATRA